MGVYSWRRIHAVLTVLVVAVAACSSSNESDATLTASTSSEPASSSRQPAGSSTTSSKTTTLENADELICTPTVSSPVTVDPQDAESPLEGEWYDRDGVKTLVVEGERIQLFDNRGTFCLDLDADPDLITFPFHFREFTTIFRVDGDRLELAIGDWTGIPTLESIEAAEAAPDAYVIELFRGSAAFVSGMWTPAGLGIPPSVWITDIAAFGETLLVGGNLRVGTTEAGLLMSTDSGASWRPVTNGLPEHGVMALAVVGNRIFAGTETQGVFVSDDGGTTWRQSNQGLAFPSAGCEDPGEPGHLRITDFAGAGSTVFVSNFCGVWRSDDLGDTWFEVDTGFVGNVYSPLPLAIGDGAAYAAMEGVGVLRMGLEEDGWQLMSDLSNVTGFTALVWSEDSLFLSAEESGVWRSDDRGTTWTQVGGVNLSDTSVFDLAVANGTMFAATARGVFWSGDNGVSWLGYNKDLTGRGYFRATGVLTPSSDRIFVGGAAGLFSAPLPDQLPPSEPTAVSPSEVPAGFETFDGSTNGFVIALPSRWLAIDVTVGDQDSIAAELEKIFPPEASETLSSSYVQNRRTAASGSGGLVMVAFDTTYDPNLTVTMFLRTLYGTLESEEDILQTFGGGEVQSVDRLEVSGREAWRLARLFSTESGDSEFIQYLVLGENFIYDIAFISSQPGANDELLSLIINTFTIADD